MDRAVVGRRNKGQVDLGFLATREFDLGLGGVFEPLEGLTVVAEIDAVVVLELVGEIVDDRVVPVVAAEVVVAVGRDDLVDATPRSRIETSNVPPPRSYTSTVWSESSSRP